MPMRPPHERTTNPRTGRLEITKTNPTHTWRDHTTKRSYYWQNGEFFLSPTGDPVDPSEVPAAFREMCENLDFIQEDRRLCRHCGQLFPISQYPDHLDLELARMADQLSNQRAAAKQNTEELGQPRTTRSRKVKRRRGRRPAKATVQPEDVAYAAGAVAE